VKLNQDFAMAVEATRYLGAKKNMDYIQSKQIAKALGFSVGYLQKVVQTLSKRGILECKRGRIGGVRIGTAVVTLLDLWEVTCGGLDFTDPPLAAMDKPLKAFRDSMRKVIIYKKPRRPR
jgi:DNA-binding IscR family transcriptional regulator